MAIFFKILTIFFKILTIFQNFDHFWADLNKLECVRKIIIQAFEWGIAKIFESDPRLLLYIPGLFWLTGISLYHHFITKSIFNITKKMPDSWSASKSVRNFESGIPVSSLCPPSSLVPTSYSLASVVVLASPFFSNDEIFCDQTLMGWRANKY